MLQVHHAAWVLPISRPPIRNGWVAILDGRIVAVGGPGEHPPAGSASAQKGLEGGAEATPWRGSPIALMPGLVNAHTHLELAWMRGRVPPANSMPTWAEHLVSLRRSVGTDAIPPIHDAIREAHASGTALVGDITNTLAAYGPLAASDLAAAVFLELIGFGGADAEAIVRRAQADLAALPAHPRLRPSMAPHAPYSVSPKLLQSIGAQTDGRPVSIHLGESADERTFLRDGTGSWRRLLEALGAWDSAWTPPGCGPVEYLDRLGLVTPRLLAVHAVHLDDGELARLARAGATVVVCPRSNRWTGAGTPDLGRIYRSRVRVAVGTDSIASVDDLSVFHEVATIRALAPDVPASAIIRSATLSGAEALGFADECGSIEPGKRAALLAVRIPAETEDVEEYLLQGIPSVDINWLAETQTSNLEP